MQKCRNAEMLKNAAPIIGVLSLQGDFAEHIKMLEGLKVTGLQVKTVEDLEKVDGLIIPGGESTVIMKLLRESGLGESIKKCVQGGMPVLGTCAGAIILSRSHLGLMDIEVDRNAYGSQVQSFIANIDVKNIGSVHAEFIRAPKITFTGSSVEVLASYEGVPVFAAQNSMLATTFHTETTGDTHVHTLFLSLFS